MPNQIINEQIHNANMCIECNNPLCYNDDEKKLVCSNCGLIVRLDRLVTTDIPNETAGAPRKNPNIHLYTTTKINEHQIQNNDLKRALLSTQNRMEYLDYKNLRAEQKIEQWNQQLRLRPDQIMDILIIYNNFQKLKKNKGFSWTCFLIAIIIKYMQNRNILLTYPKASVICDEDSEKIRKALKKFEKSLITFADDHTKQNFVKKINKYLGKRTENNLTTQLMNLFYELDAELRFLPRIINQIVRLINSTNDRWFMGRSRPGILGGIIYYVHMHSNVNEPICENHEISIQFLANRLNISQFTIRTTYNYLSERDQ